MKQNVKNYYFSIVKLFCIILLIIYFVYHSEKSLHDISVEWFLLTMSLLSSLGFEVVGGSRILEKNHTLHGYEWKELLTNNKTILKVICLFVEVVMMLLVVFKFNDGVGLYLIPIVLMDAVVFFHLSIGFGFLALLGIFLNQENAFIYTSYNVFILIIYYQNFYIIDRYKRYIEDFEQEEYHLKDSIHAKDTIYKEQLEKSSLSFENKMLEDKARLSQALHDKLGHSINGSIYQLEACKILMDKDQKQSNLIMQGVIDNLRTSMDEIRKILRREKPDKKRMAYLQLVQLCEECKGKYGIEAEVTIDGENQEVPEYLWDVILDNTIEAVTNALKYAKCNKLRIEIIILHKVIRCIIVDDGIGCNHLKEGMGLQGMKNRTRKVNGVLDINCDNGFRINMIIPL